MRSARYRRLAASLTLATGLVMASVALGVQPASASVLPTATTVTTNANPGAAGGTATYTAVVTVLGTSLGPIAPTGTVTFQVGSQSATVPLGSCLLLIQQCTASATLTLPATSGTVNATATYNGSLIARASTGSVAQQVSGPKTCTSDVPCSHSATAADGSARLRIDTPSLGVSGYEYQILISFSDLGHTCSTAGGGDTGVFDVTAPIDVLPGAPDKHKHQKGKGHTSPGHPDGTVPDNPVKDVTYDLFGPFAQAIHSSGVDQVCWASDTPFTTASGQQAQLQPNGLYEGVLPRCGVGVSRPCQDGASQFFPAGEGPAVLRTKVLAPAGDPRVTR